LSLYERHEIRLRDEEVTRIACVLNEALGTTPTFCSDEQVAEYLSVGV
jgi:hypothetical protein